MDGTHTCSLLGSLVTGGPSLDVAAALQSSCSKKSRGASRIMAASERV